MILEKIVESRMGENTYVVGDESTKKCIVVDPGANFIDIIAIQSLVHMAASYIPTPGTAGASEGGYYLLFKPLFTKNLIVYAVLLWRAISYYFRIIFTGLVTLIDYVIRKKKITA